MIEFPIYIGRYRSVISNDPFNKKKRLMTDAEK
jgi:hypothetical protein